jgi:hypothetical protein
MASYVSKLRPRSGNYTAAPIGVPPGYVRLDEFNTTVNKNGKYSGIQGKGVKEAGIWVKEHKGKILLWWEKPEHQFDNFFYSGKSQEDIDACYAKLGHQKMEALGSGYTWHHTGYPTEESYGTMQLVPTHEHSALTHIGGAAISQGKY